MKKRIRKIEEGRASFLKQRENENKKYRQRKNGSRNRRADEATTRENEGQSRRGEKAQETRINSP